MRRITPQVLNRFAPVFLLIVSILAFGLLLPFLGFYWDDWAKILVSRLYGLSGYFAYYAEDRPLSAWTHIVFTPLLGSSPLAWQIFALALRWLSAWAMWRVLNLVWPAARQQNLAAALLYLIYPVFTAQSAAVTFHQQWLQYLLFFLSLAAMLRAQRAAQAAPASRKPVIAWTALSLALSILQLSVTEYFAPLELIRPFLLWCFIQEPAGATPAHNDRRVRFRQRALGVLRAWAPYLVLVALFSIYRLFIQQFPGADPYKAKTLDLLLSDPLGTLKNLSFTVFIDELRILFTSWSELVSIELVDPSPMTLLSYAVAHAAGVIAAIYLAWVGKTSQPAAPGSEQAWLRQVLLVGAAAVLLGPIPAWITGRQVVFDFHSDRYAMPAMFGAALLFSGLVGWIAQRPVQRAVLVAMLVTAAVGVHVRTANEYRWIWTDQLRTYWQLSWRAPGLKENTAIFFETEPFPNQGLFSTSAAINLLYPQEKKPDPTSLDLYYWVYTLRPRYSHAPDTPVNSVSTQFRTLKFKGSTPQSLLIYKKAGSCLWVLSPDDSQNPDLPDLVSSWLSVANLDQIIASGDGVAAPPEEMFGAEPQHDWCYYFQKASLAAQLEDWQTAADLADQAARLGYSPANPEAASPYEWIPFIRGLAGVGRWDEAASFTRQAYALDSDYSAMYCRLWQERLPQDEGGASARESIQVELGCAPAD